MSIRIFAMFDSDWLSCCCSNWKGLNSQWTTSGWQRSPLPVEWIDDDCQTYHLVVNLMIWADDWLIDLIGAPFGGEHLSDPSKLIGRDHFVILLDGMGHSPTPIGLIQFYSSWRPRIHRVLLDGLSPKNFKITLSKIILPIFFIFYLGSFNFQFIFIRIWSWIVCNGTGIWLMWKKGSNTRMNHM